MRPKVVILTLVVAFGLLGIVAVFKGLANRRVENPSEPMPRVAAGSASSDSNALATHVTGNVTNPAALEQIRAAVIAKAIEEIQELQSEADGTNNPVIISALLDKLAHPEPEVRKAALGALKELNDTNAIPGLQKTAAAAKDPREQVAVLDVIDYLKLPNITADVDPKYATNIVEVTTLPREGNMNPSFLRKGRKNDRTANSGSQTKSQDAPATPPQ